MSNYLAIATVTSVLRNLLEKNPPPSSLTVRLGRPVSDMEGTAGGKSGVNIFLYQVTSNPALLNCSVPTRRGDGSLLQRSQSALVLHYLLSFWGVEEESIKDKELTAQNVLAASVRKLNSHPVLTRKDIENVVASPNFADSDLADYVEQVKFTMKALSLEDLSKLWSVFFQTPYYLSVAYEASVVLIEADETPQEALPVLERKVYVRPFKEPLIEEIVVKDGTIVDPIPAKSKITIRGKNLKGDETMVLIDGGEIVPDNVSNNEIRCTLPPILHAGVHGVQISHKIMMGKKNDEKPHQGVESRVFSFVLTPTITVSVAGVDIAVKCIPNISKQQRVVLFLNELQPIPSPQTAELYSFARPPSKPTDPDETDTVVFQTKGVISHDYLVRLQVDGAASRLDVDPLSGQFISPKVTM